MRRTEFFWDKNLALDSGSCSINKNNADAGNGQSLPFKFTMFKVPSFDSVPVKKARTKPLTSPIRRVQGGRVKNDSKQKQKTSIRSHTSFINPGLHYSRNSVLSRKRDLIQKMVYVTEYAIKENRQVKPSTPIKVPTPMMTPRKTPIPDEFRFTVPEMKKTPRREDLGTPMQDILLRKALSVCSVKRTPVSLKKVVPKPEGKSILNLEVKEPINFDLPNLPNDRVTLCRILRHCQNYNSQVNDVYEKLKKLEQCFEMNIENLPDCEVYNEFCLYQAKKEELYRQIKPLEEKLENAIKNHANVGRSLSEYVRKRREIFDKRLKLHQEFEEVVRGALQKCDGIKEDKENLKIEKEEPKPKLRRSLRLSKIPKKCKVDEKTPMSRKLQKLDSKSRRIQRDDKVRPLRF